MNKIIKKTIFIVFLIVLTACSDKVNNKNISNKNNIKDPIILYKSAILEIEKKQYMEAIPILNEISIKYPLSNEAIQSQIMLAFIDYLQMNYDESVLKFRASNTWCLKSLKCMCLIRFILFSKKLIGSIPAKYMWPVSAQRCTSSGSVPDKSL